MTSLRAENKRLHAVVAEAHQTLSTLALAATNLAMATPDVRLRHELDRAVRITRTFAKTIEPDTKVPETENAERDLEEELKEARATADLYKAALVKARTELEQAHAYVDGVVGEKAPRAMPLSERLPYLVFDRLPALTADVAALKDQLEEEKRISKAHIKRAEDLISHHRLECTHTRKLPDGSRDAQYSDIFMLSDEDSYDVCTCLKNFVSKHEHDNAVAMITQLQALLTEVTDARDAMKPEVDRARTQEDKFAKALENLSLQVCQALEKAMRSSPLSFPEAITYIGVLGRERDEFREKWLKILAQAEKEIHGSAQRENRLQVQLATVLEKCEHDDGCRRMVLLAGHSKGINPPPGDGHYDDCDCWLSRDLDPTISEWLEKRDKRNLAIGRRDQESKDYDNFVAWLSDSRPVSMSDAVYAAMSLHDEKVKNELRKTFDFSEDHFRTSILERIAPTLSALAGLRVGPNEDMDCPEAVFVQGKAQGGFFDARDVRPLEMLPYLRDLSEEFKGLRESAQITGLIGNIPIKPGAHTFACLIKFTDSFDPECPCAKIQHLPKGPLPKVPGTIEDDFKALGLVEVEPGRWKKPGAP